MEGAEPGALFTNYNHKNGQYKYENMIMFAAKVTIVKKGRGTKDESSDFIEHE